MDEALREARRDAKRETCVVCTASGTTTPATTRVEAHHIGGHHHDANATVPVCARHHRELSEKIRDAGSDMRAQPRFAHTVIHALRAVAALLMIVAAALLGWADRLLADLLRHGEASYA